MRSVSIESDNGIFEGSIQLYVMTQSTWKSLSRKIENIEGVEEVAVLISNNIYCLSKFLALKN
jgi:hypothetical protein